jgi:ATP-dependent RNA helicase RhlE
MASFSSFGLLPALEQALIASNYQNPYPIQELAIPAIMKNKDVLGISPTGSGKTLGYVLPVLMQLQKTSIANNRKIQVLVLVPTRELATQVKDVFQKFATALPSPIKTMAVFGGVSINPQMKNLMGVNILVATPGRLIDLLESKALQLSETQVLILDEADKMLNQGFELEMQKILPLLPKKRQNLLFSATLSDKVNDIKNLLLDNPEVIKIAAEEYSLDLIKQIAYRVDEDKKGVLLRSLINDQKMKQVLIFTASGFKADSVAHKLRKNGITAEAIHGKKSQGGRTHVLQQFKNGHIQALVATDLLARGIDISFLPHVINYELPRSPKDFVHRIGRTGRAENPGEAITFVSPEEEHHFKVIQKKMGKTVDLKDSLI